MTAYGADFDGQVNTNCHSLATFTTKAAVDVTPVINGTSTSLATFHVATDVWYSQSDALVLITNHYHKRGWRTESNDYVEWESTDRNSPYPGGGTIDPAVGTVVYQWVTYSNGQAPG
jgi:hypothetical protein